MNSNRKGEEGPVPYRTGRFFCVDSQWFFTTREGLDHGPFPTKEKAEWECQTYINVCLKIEERLGTKTVRQID
ncbi:MAG: DUF6316 family protein [Gammaproteobacteria bacterium]|nr:DUF6316 family protein [Gammaproteobacteria bacterium]